MAEIRRIKIGAASCGLAAGAGEVLSAFRKKNLSFPVVETGCIGHCYAEPIVEAELSDGSSVFYGQVKGDERSVEAILSLSEEGRFTVPEERRKLEKLLVTRLAGRIDPKDLEEYRANGGFSSLAKAFDIPSIRDESTDLSACAENYLAGIGMTDAEIAALKECLAKDYGGFAGTSG